MKEDKLSAVNVYSEYPDDFINNLIRFAVIQIIISREWNKSWFKSFRIADCIECSNIISSIKSASRIIFNPVAGLSISLWILACSWICKYFIYSSILSIIFNYIVNPVDVSIILTLSESMIG